MRCLLLSIFLFLFGCTSFSQQEKDKITIKAEKQSELKVLESFSGKPDSEGILASFSFNLPKFSSGCFYVQDTLWGSWPAGANRILPFPFKDKVKADYQNGGMFVYFHLTNGNYLVLLPVISEKAMSWFEIMPDNKLKLNFGNLGTEKIAGDFPLLSWSVSDDLYQACYNVWENVIHHPEFTINTDWRINKNYPEAFEYLGWCSWEEYRVRINEELLLKSHDNIIRSGIPVRYMLVDDGHQQEIQNESLGFEPDTEKFPNGWETLIERKDPEKVKWMGLWHAMIGNWRGVHPDFSQPGIDNSIFEKLPFNSFGGNREEGIYFVKSGIESSGQFYFNLMKTVNDQGFDFVKIDLQSANLKVYMRTGNALEAANENALALEEGAEKYTNGMINCMAHNAHCAFHSKYSAVTRSSIDYLKGSLERARSHIWQSYNNALWMCQTVWGDHDMFHSNDTVSARLMAVSKAMSGAPVYLSDPPANFVAENIMPLCYEDGRLLRPIAPAFPTSESAMINPIQEKNPYIVVAPLENSTAAVVAYNLHENNETSLEVAVGKEQYQQASGLSQPYHGPWNLPSEGLLVYDWFEKSASKLDGKMHFKLKGFSDKLILMLPLKNGRAVIGRIDKFLSPASYQLLEENQENLKIELKESGPFAVYSENGIPWADKVQFKKKGINLYFADLSIGEKNKQITVHFKND